VSWFTVEVSAAGLSTRGIPWRHASTAAGSASREQQSSSLLTDVW
jgi:hypothetical protein